MKSDFEKSLARLIKLAAEIDDWCNAIHSSAWKEPMSGIPAKMEKWKQLAKHLFDD